MKRSRGRGDNWTAPVLAERAHEDDARSMRAMGAAQLSPSENGSYLEAIELEKG
jgi:hypothetical protein